MDWKTRTEIFSADFDNGVSCDQQTIKFEQQQPGTIKMINLPKTTNITCSATFTASTSLVKHHHNHFNQLYKKIFVQQPHHPIMNINNNSSSLSSPTTTTIHHDPNNNEEQQQTNNNRPHYFVHKQSTLRKPIRVVTFDMDGTLTVPVIDFKRMRQLTGISAPTDVLDHIHELKDEMEKKRLFDLINMVESEANDKLAFQPFLFETLDELKLESLNENSQLKHFAIVTRNSESTLKLFIEKLGSNYSNFFEILHGREFLPYKPNPHCLIRIAQELDIPIENMIMIGDSYHDIVCAKKAGAISCLYTQENDWEDKHSECVEQYEPDFICHDLRHIIDIVKFQSTTTTTL